MSGSRKNTLQSALDEIITMNKNKSAPPVDGEYFCEQTPRLSAAEKKRKGEQLRRKVRLFNCCFKSMKLFKSELLNF
jgi:hypothetical protein